MEVDSYPDSANLVTDEHLPDPLVKKDEHYISQSSSANTFDEPRKRSHSLLHLMQKTITNVANFRPHHGHSSSRKRSQTITQPDNPSPPRRSPPISQPFARHGRPRAPSIDSDGSKGKRIPIQKKVIFDTDAQAQQSHSVLQFAFGR